MLRGLLREPLVHFLALALAIFAVYSALNGSESVTPGRIVVTQGKIEQMAVLFARTWQRTPTPTELKGLIDDHVREEIYYREALALGLDADDTVIRRRLRQKMEFLDDTAIEALTPTDAELEQYLEANPVKFSIDPAVAFRQVYLNPERRGDKANADARAILETLRADPSLDPASLGDTTLLPSELPFSTKASIGQTFGADFADAISNATPGAWTGPLKSSFGLHVVRVDAAKPGRAPALDEVRDAVAREWANEKRKALAEQRFGDLMKRYEVSIEAPAEKSASAEASP